MRTAALMLFLASAGCASANHCKCVVDLERDARELITAAQTKIRTCKYDDSWNENLPDCVAATTIGGDASCDQCPAPQCDKLGGTCVSDCVACTKGCKRLAVTARKIFLSNMQCSVADGACDDGKVCCVPRAPSCDDVGGTCVATCDALTCLELRWRDARALALGVPPGADESDEAAQARRNAALSAIEAQRAAALRTLADKVDALKCVAPSIGACRNANEICCRYNPNFLDMYRMPHTD
ncbi:hypothetical protein JKP88DRAFT_243403 [Tribonema minus]|uniref:Uncharacterized protein n=1 Tax=Tribonema minus TaxID=303371 RepID=A0A835Z7J1_9STRA|nr:hypothetical protein JKP88DRAFT_243403 [Tribonema minus]